MSFRSKLKPKSAADAIEEEARKLKENEETALVLKQFIETFEEPVNVNKTWVKGGVVTPGSSVQSLEGAGRVYQPYLKTLEKTAEKFKDRLSSEVEKSSNLGLKKDQAKKKSNLEAFSEELKQMQQEREMRQLKRKSAVDRVDDTTIKYGSDIELKASEETLDSPYENENDRTSTNLFLGNLNPELTEQQLCELFGRFGPLASVKIMWPRSDEEKARGRNCGFVAFMNRTDGERALDKLRGEEICGYEMKLGWGKTVLIPPYPVYVPPALQELIKAPPFSGLPFNAQPREWLERQERGLPISDRIMYDMTSMPDDEMAEVLKTCVVKVVIPTDRSLMQLINRMVEFVVKEGVEFEAFIMNKEMRNPHFKFLFDFQSSEHTYYRWKLYSILHGESAKTWKTAEFQMYVDGPYWRPPPLNPYTAGMPEELIVDFDVSKLTLDNIRSMDQVTQNEHCRESVVAPVSGSTVNSSSTACMDNPYNHNNPYKRLLSDGQRDRLMEMLTDLEPTKLCIGETMVWCLEHADSAEEVVDVIVQQLDRSISDSIESSSSGLNRIVAHIFLVSDILHNSCAKVRNASYYRKFIENVLSQIMIAYNRYYLAIASKVKSEQLKHTVLTCFRAWGDWYVYPYDFLLKLQNQFLGISEPAAVVPDEKTDTKVNSDDNMLDRKPLVDYDGDPLDLDGVPLESSNNLSAAKTNDSSHNNNIIDMFATSNSPTSTKNSDGAALFVASKWETIDPAEEESEMVQSRWHLLEAQMDERKSDNDDPDGYPLSDNDGFDLNKIMMPESQNYRSMTSLVSYEKGSSDDEVEEVKPVSGVAGEGARASKKSKKKDKRRRGVSSEEDGARRSRRRTEEAVDEEEDTHQEEDRRRYRPEVVEVRSKVIRLEHRDDDRESSKRSKRSPKDSRKSRDWTDKHGGGGYSDMKRKRSRSRSQSPAAKRSSHRRRSRDKRH